MLPPAHVLASGHEDAFHLAKSREALYVVHLKSGEYAEIQVEQAEGLVQATVIDADGRAHTPHLLDAGKGSIIPVPVIATAEGDYRIRVSVRVAAPGASGTIRLLPSHLATSSDLERARAWDMFARADWIRKTADRSKLAEALRDYNAALRSAQVLRDWKLARAALTGKARILIFQAMDYAAGRAAIQQAVAVPGSASDSSGEALAWKTLSSADYYLGEYHASIAAAKQALALYKSTGDEYWQGIVLGNLADTYQEVGDPAGSLAAGKAALRIAQLIGDPFGMDYDLGAMAAAHMARGEFQQSLNLYYRAINACQKQPYAEAEANDWLGLGDIYEQLGDDTRARQGFQKAVVFSRKARDSADELNALGFLGDLALRQDRVKEAESYYQYALSAANSQQLVPEQTFLLVRLGRAYAAAGERQLAMASVERALAIARRISQVNGKGRAFQTLGDLYATSAQPVQAAAAYRQAYAIWNEEGHRVRMAASLASLARIEFDSGELAPADSHIESALDLIDSARATITSRDLRTAYFASRHSYYDLAVDVLMALDKTHPRNDYQARALEMAERARARTLLDAIDRSPSGSAGNIPPELLSVEREVSEQLDAAYNRLRDAMGSQAASKKTIRRVEARIEDLLRQGDAIESQIRDADPQYAAMARGAPVRLTEIEQHVTSSGSALLEYWVGEHESFLWVVTRHGLESFTLPPSNVLSNLVMQYRRDLLARARYPAGEGFFRRHQRLEVADTRSVTESLELGRLLLDPAAARLAAVHTLVIVPDGPLWMLPFAALRMQSIQESRFKIQNDAGTGQRARLETAPIQNPKSKIQNERSKYLIARFRIAEEPSASVLLSLIQRKRPTRTGCFSNSVGSRVRGCHRARIAIFADPVYTASDPRVPPEFRRRVGSASSLLAAVSRVAPVGPRPARDVAPASRRPRRIRHLLGASEVARTSGRSWPTVRASAAPRQSPLVHSYKPFSNTAAPAAITRWVSEAGMGHLPRLLGARQEALEIATLAGSEHVMLRTGFAARADAVRSFDWSQYDIVHFAAHAMVNPVNPAFSGIVLSMVNPHGLPENGVLWLNEVYGLRMPVSLVVLSGCRTSAGREIPGEGVAGLSRAFFFAGAQRVMGSLWSIEDQETSAIMKLFYDRLLNTGSTAAESLRAAQLQMAGSRDASAPYFWAGIVLQGAPD